MKLLILTQTVDTQNPVLGFFHRWIEEFAKHAEQVTVICLKEGEHNLPENVKVLSLGKEGGASRLKYIWNFYRYIIRERKNYDSVFVHMNQIYVILGGLLWRFWGKKIGLWYVHGSVPLTLTFAIPFVHFAFTTSPESLQIKSSKIRVMGHGIDLSQFPITRREKSDTLCVLTTGRVAKVKRIKEMIQAVSLLKERGIDVRFNIVGGPVTKNDVEYEESLKKNIGDDVFFCGPVAHSRIPDFMKDADVFINLSSTESMDKAVLEALMTGVPVVSSNQAFKNTLSPLGLFVNSVDPNVVADALLNAQKIDVSNLTKSMRDKHSLQSLIVRVYDQLIRT